ncbi:MAG: hypothetical protein JO331_03580, partial [Verrucomicrobia bacterium]|nr:hypothetical protein [Verrucomicrobiota bacterium]
LAPSSITPKRILADDDYVVVECQGDATTLSGARYANTYCLVIRLVDGRLREMTEYMDTALVERVLQPPPWYDHRAALERPSEAVSNTRWALQRFGPVAATQRAGIPRRQHFTNFCVSQWLFL